MEKETFLKYLHQHKHLNEESLETLKKLIDEHPWFQAGWMLYLKNLKSLNSENFEATLKQVALMVPDRKRLYRFLNDEIDLSDSNNYKLPEFDDAPGDSLIDRFLSSKQAGLRPGNYAEKQAKETDNKHIIEKSVTESDELITETLAYIHFQQKNYEKALDAYKKLSLKYPEKSIYFASRIKEIEELKNNN